VYIAEILNKNNLLQHFGSYVNKNRNTNSDEFLFHATSAMICLQRIYLLNDISVKQVTNIKERLLIKDDKIVFWSPFFVELLSLIPNIFTSLVIMQNKVFPLLKHPVGFKKDAQSSMREAVKDIYKYNLPKPIMAKIHDYWSEFGLPARQYRDIAEHHYKLLSNSYYQFIPAEKVVIYLPDDPKQKSNKKYIYNKKIDCVSYLEESLLEFYSFLDLVFQELGFHSENISQSITPGVEIRTEKNVEKTILLVLADSNGRLGWEMRQSEKRTMSFNRWDLNEST
jgi:hypothetical protein